jgi:hypothetical protein
MIKKEKEQGNLYSWSFWLSRQPFWDEIIFIIGGDFNAKHTQWGSRLITPKGCELYKAAVDYGCEFASTGKPTYWPANPNKTPDLIDFFVIKNISSNYIKVKQSLDLNSDHSPMHLTVSDNIIMKYQNSVLTIKHTDWDRFNYSYLLECKINLSVSIKTNEKLEKKNWILLRLPFKKPPGTVLPLSKES